MPVSPLIDARRNRVIVLEDMNFVWDENELIKIAKWDASGYDLFQIGEFLKRDPDEVWAAWMDLARQGKLLKKVNKEEIKMQQHKMKHAEAFCLMTYKCDSCKEEEELWNSRDGVTPFIIGCRQCGGESSHINFRADKFLPKYTPFIGQRIFVDMTEETKLEIAEKRFEQAKGTLYEIAVEDKEEFIRSFLSGFHEGTPDVVIWQAE